MICLGMAFTWQHAPCVPRRHFCRRLSGAARLHPNRASRGVSTQHALARAPHPSAGWQKCALGDSFGEGKIECHAYSRPFDVEIELAAVRKRDFSSHIQPQSGAGGEVARLLAAVKAFEDAVLFALGNGAAAIDDADEE